MSKLDKYEIRTTIGGDISIVEIDNKNSFDGLSFFKDKSKDKSNDAILAVMKFLESRIKDGEGSITVSSNFGELTYTKKDGN